MVRLKRKKPEQNSNINIYIFYHLNLNSTINLLLVTASFSSFFFLLAIQLLEWNLLLGRFQISDSGYGKCGAF